MQRAYESFTEIADDFSDGESKSHLLSEHTAEDCIAWQRGVKEFAQFLDGAGLKMVIKPEIYDKLWEMINA